VWSADVRGRPRNRYRDDAAECPILAASGVWFLPCRGLLAFPRCRFQCSTSIFFGTILTPPAVTIHGQTPRESPPDFAPNLASTILGPRVIDDFFGLIVPFCFLDSRSSTLGALGGGSLAGLGESRCLACFLLVCAAVGWASLHSLSFAAFTAAQRDKRRADQRGAGHAPQVAIQQSRGRVFAATNQFPQGRIPSMQAMPPNTRQNANRKAIIEQL